MHSEWILVGAWYLILTPFTLRRLWRSWRLALATRDQVLFLDAALVSVGWLLTQLCWPLAIMYASRDNAVADVYRLRHVLTTAEASEIIRQSESHAERTGGWASDRHMWYPTTDVAVSSLDIDARLRVIIRDRVYPVLSAGYGVPADDMSLRDLFVVKYSGGAQRGLVRHRDGCELSFGIALTAKHDESAGTYFASFRYLLRNVQIGELWTHPSLVLHAARSVSQEDLRYVLIGFVQVRPTWKRFWRTWGAWATQLKEWQIDVSLEHEMQHLLFASASISTPTLAKRRLRKIFRELSAAEAPLAGKALVLIAVFLCLTLCVLSCMCVYDIMRHLCLASHCMPDECDQNDNTEALARGRYADDAKARTQLRCSPSTRGAVPARTREDAAAERSTESAARRRGKTLSVWQSKDNACDIFGLENGRRFTTTR